MFLRDGYELRSRLIEHEGIRLQPYEDSLGFISIGIGHNLAANGLTMRQVEQIFEDDIAIAEKQAQMFPWYAKLDAPRQTVIVELVFNMGLRTLRKFKKMLAAISAGDFEVASHELVESRWYTQVGKERGDHLATVLRTGRYK